MELREYQKDALSKMHNGCILCGGVGSGKSLTALAYAKLHGYLDVYIITTARKRDTNEWESDIQKHGGLEEYTFKVDSWNNIKKYVDVKDAFFIFDEQRVIGHGEWVKCFLQITKKTNGFSSPLHREILGKTTFQCLLRMDSIKTERNSCINMLFLVNFRNTLR